MSAVEKEIVAFMQRNELKSLAWIMSCLRNAHYTKKEIAGAFNVYIKH